MGSRNDHEHWWVNLMIVLFLFGMFARSCRIDKLEDRVDAIEAEEPSP